MKRGLLIGLEGVDCSGKSTQAVLLEKNIKNGELLRFPQRESQTGKIINDYLKGKQQMGGQVIHLLFSANRWEFHDYIQKQILAGKNIILDRYAASGVVYSAAKGLDSNWCKFCDQGLWKPDLTFYMDITEKEQISRKGFGSEIYENTEFQRKVREKYNLIMDKTWITIDGQMQIEKIQDQILNQIENVQCQNELQKLW